MLAGDMSHIRLKKGGAFTKASDIFSILRGGHVSLAICEGY